MPSAVEQLAANLDLSTLGKAKELRQRILFTLGALIVYRFGTFVPVPGINPGALADLFAQNSQGIVGMFDMFSGGAIGRMAIFALNIIPYISASIIVQLLTSSVPHLEALKKEGESGRRKINQYTRYLTVFLALFQSFGIAVGLESSTGVVANPGLLFQISTVVSLTGGTIFLMWLGEQITARGVGNGISLIIYAGIVAELPTALISTLELGRQGALAPGVIVTLLVMVAVVIYVIVLFERAQRRLLVQYPKRQQGNKMFQGDTSHLPLKVNTAGVIPAIFASSLLLLPLTFANFTGGDSGGVINTVTAILGHGQPLYMVAYASLIAFFCFFYTAVVSNPEDMADNLKRQGGFIPGIRPGPMTANHIDFVLTRITVVGAIYLVVICLIPEFLIAFYPVPFYFGGTSLLIVVSVTMDTVSQIQGHMFAHQYEGLIKKSKLRGGKK
ncbi:MAG: preprotein translocase subunit SecY [SAR116 cluster bacterium]|nr:MAG: preprotein translocase subunit SecY [SAR116 cluster bacterium]HBQ22806.1 preprotein translocase subunit SecY [Alphaproteobacteria bacterium]|tara:strand:- start:356 stop:1687 length:1332 start_codon:yes stop_codon:yes gene_type:complete